jgi:hypothetical protein
MQVSKYLSDMFPVKNGLRMFLSTLIFNFALEYILNKVQKSQVVFNVYGKYQVLVLTGDVNNAIQNILDWCCFCVSSKHR